MLGAIIGDIVGSRFEFDNHRDKAFELFHKDCFFTDDTVMTLAIAKAIMAFRLRAPWCMSLKDKRSEVKHLVMGLRNKFNVSACESGEQDVLTLIEIAVAALASSSAQADSIAESLLDFVEDNSEAEIIAVQNEYR